MVEYMLQMTKLQHGAIVECKREDFKKLIFSCTNKWFLAKHIPRKDNKKCSLTKKPFDDVYHEAQKCLMSWDILKDKEIYQKHLYEHKKLIQRKKNMGSYSTNYPNARESTCMC